MQVPSWKNTELGTMKRAALWLVQRIGEGNTFTKEELRSDFHGVAQIDRRMRDLRDFGWRIDTSREDAALRQDEQRFVSAGEPVWEPGKATKKREGHAISAVQRRELLARANYVCRSCGIPAGHTYSGTYETAQLDVARRAVVSSDGSRSTQLVVECGRCRVGGRALEVDLGDLTARLSRLSAFDRQILAGWMRDGEREFSEVEKLWGLYQALPAESQAELMGRLG
ncbi:hypothetical protein [Nonomuraea sp. B1E8]|uniref:hypothetical protein n=1 Tax=unclassified Nonomuraea TaxID=2593643 RepID=UPI00325DDB12